MTRRKLPALFAAAAMALTLTACGDEKADPIPSPTATETPTADVSPAPDAPELNADQQKAYDDALAVYTKYRDFVTKISQDPVVTKDRVREVANVATRAEIDGLSDEIKELADAEARVEGEREVAWTVPLEVSSKKVTLRQCETPGDWVLIGSDGTKAPGTKNRAATVTVVQISDRWFVNKVEGGREC